MVSRLVLGCGTTGHALVEAVSEWRGELFVLDGDESRVESLRNEKVAAEVRDVTDPDAIRHVEQAVDVVVVATDAADTNRLAAEAAREVYPDAELVAYLGFDATETDRRELNRLADRVVDPGEAVLDHVEELTASGAEDRLQALR